MLDRGKELLPEDVVSKERFEIPKVRGHIEGAKTIVSNFQQIAETLRRPAKHMLKYIQKEMATPGEFRKNAVIFGTKLSASKLNEKIRKYAEEFVLCKECGKPDTKITKDGDIVFIKCQACGARHSVYSRNL